MFQRFMSALALTALVAAPVLAQPGPAGEYAVDADASEVHWLIYRSGALARLGHNHVISVGPMQGTVSVARDWAESSFELEIPVDGLVVDDSELRAAAGEGFESEPSAEDVAGTRRNMLSEGVLDGEAHPALRIAGSSPTGTPADGEVTLTLDVAGREAVVTAPVSIEFDGDMLTATGQFQLTHEQLGLEPFSVMMGAIKVGEELDFSYRIVARRTAGPR